MSLRSITLLLFLVAGLVDCIRLPIIVQDVLGIDNKRWLSRYPDVRRAICDKTSPLWQTIHENDTRLPQNLFHNLEINNNRVGISRLGWKNAADRLAEMKGCRAALQDVRHLQIDIYVHNSIYSDYTEDSMPSPELAELFAEVLPYMTNLKRLDFGVSGKSSASFEKAFTNANVTLPSVTHLRPGAYSDWLLPRCPNIETVDAGSFFHHWSWNDYDPEWKPKVDKYNALIDAMRGLPVGKLTLFHRDWKLETIQRIADASSNLTFLSMEGPLNLYNQMRLPEGEALKRYLSNIAQFSQLEELRLPPAFELDLGFDGGPGCGNAYFGKEGRAYGRAVTRQSAETTEVAARIVHEALPKLKSLSIGSQCPNLTRNDAGTMDMSWPWTGRMTEYTYEVWNE